jgi:DNA-binding MarR family transcriptional regulator
MTKAMKSQPDKAVRDSVDLMFEQWARERPDLDLFPLGVIGRLSRISRHYELKIEETLAKYGLNGPAFYVLAALRRSGHPYRLSPTELYSSLLVSSGAMTNRIDRLQAAGFVRRVPDPDDGRAVQVALTSKGRRLIDFALEGHNANERRLLQALTNDELQTLAALLRRLLAAEEASATEPYERLKPLKRANVPDLLDRQID